MTGKSSRNGVVAADESFKPFETTTGVKFVSAGLAASVAEIVTMPIDTSKVRLQIQGESAITQMAKDGALHVKKYRGLIGTLFTIAREEGVRSLYSGLVPAIHRQLAFASIRIGLYDRVKELYGDDGSGSHPKVLTKIAASITTGTFAVCLFQCTDVVKIRMQASGVKNARYSGAFNAYHTIYVQEGVKGLWKGSFANIARLSLVNVSEVVVYDIIKSFFLARRLLHDNIPLHLVSAFGAGFAATVIASPVDVVKTRFMNSAPGQYKSALHCAVETMKHNGPTAFYKGFTPNFMRLGSWNIVMFLTYEQLKRAISTLTTSSN
ncbi:mitochondrial uncoupling protein 3-like [Dendronephthya gigantea]|uniref:mitochondrial uncoupling protein 3-like n=1 Tax=Dendronephthya gigantea TaxID=151771 RepID=UPI00106DBACD|nr:mitochondrial uncoupling protein 3-like [Dendronephthya gigantea]